MATKEELMDLARELDIPGRSGMSKDELEAALADYQDSNTNNEIVVADGTVRIIARRWNRFVNERTNRPSEGEQDLLDLVTFEDDYAIMPIRVAAAFGIHPSFYDAS